MNEKELGKALLKLDLKRLSTERNDRDLTRRILERDRRRVWLLTALALVLWTLALAGVFFVLYALLGLYPSQTQAMRDIGPGQVIEAQRRQSDAVHWMVVTKATVVVAGSVAILSLAALATITLSIASRGATLRQLNASLLEISMQLKELRSSGPR
jgi:hypothetical protein